jgi:hypothetical protein
MCLVPPWIYIFLCSYHMYAFSSDFTRCSLGSCTRVHQTWAPVTSKVPPVCLGKGGRLRSLQELRWRRRTDWKGPAAREGAQAGRASDERGIRLRPRRYAPRHAIGWNSHLAISSIPF